MKAWSGKGVVGCVFGHVLSVSFSLLWQIGKGKGDVACVCLSRSNIFITLENVPILILKLIISNICSFWNKSIFLSNIYMHWTNLQHVKWIFLIIHQDFQVLMRAVFYSYFTCGYQALSPLIVYRGPASHVYAFEKLLSFYITLCFWSSSLSKG